MPNKRRLKVFSFESNFVSSFWGAVHLLVAPTRTPTPIGVSKIEVIATPIATVPLPTATVLLTEILKPTDTRVSDVPKPTSTSTPKITETPKPTVRPTNTVKPTDKPTSTPALQKLSGTGQQVSPKFSLNTGLAIFRMKHGGSGHFGIWLLDNTCNKKELLVNEVGGFDGAKAVGISQSGIYILDVSADATWTVSIEQPSTVSAPPAPSKITGRGQQASQLFTLSSGLTIFRMTHDGNGHFGIWLLDSKGNETELLVNEVGKFNGSKAVGIRSSGVYLLDISADGNWAVTIEK